MIVASNQRLFIVADRYFAPFVLKNVVLFSFFRIVSCTALVIASSLTVLSRLSPPGDNTAP
jgi:hypothetical protein